MRMLLDTCALLWFLRNDAELSGSAATPQERLLTGCLGQIVMGPSEDIWCYPDSPDLDMVWVAFEDDIRPIRQVSAAWLETL